MATAKLGARGTTATVQPHLVQFYETEEFLARAATEYLAEGARAGEPLLLVVTPTRRQLFLDQLAAAGVDVQVALAREQLTVVDARETLATFMTPGGPDPALFARHVGARVNGLVARHPGKKLRAYGEMVDLLWRDGASSAAVRLEELWSELQRRQPFSLFCAYAIGNFLKGSDREKVMAAHTHVLPGELLQREAIEQALREAVRQQHVTERLLKSITDAVPALVSYIDRDHVYRFMNRTYGEWFGVETASLVNRHAREVLGDTLYEITRPRLDEALAGKPVHYQTRAPYKYGPERVVEATYVPHRAESGEVLGVTVMVRDVTETTRLRRTNDRLLEVTQAIAAAITPEQVYEAMVENVAEAMGSHTAALWVVGDDGRARMARSRGYRSEIVASYSQLELDSNVRLPVLDALRGGQVVWFSSIEALVTAYPNLANLRASAYQGVACIPLIVEGQPRGVLSLSFKEAGEVGEDDLPFLTMLARYGSQALERLRLVNAEKKNRAQAELLFSLAQNVIHAQKVDEIFPPTLEAIDSTLGARRSAVLLYDASGVMRFRAWRGLSDDYRQAVEGHSPWPRDAQNPQIVWVADAATDASVAPHRELFARERIAALGFVPLVASGRLLGKLMVYYDQPRVLTANELELARAIANHVAAATARFEALDELQRTVKFNELFTAILGHDLRNPLGAIMTAAQLLLRRAEDEKITRPLSRIMSSGDRMARMIEQLLDFTRVRMGSGIPLAPARADLKPVVEEVVSELAEQNPEAQVRLEVVGDTVGSWDADRLAQVFSNLVGNAIQHGSGGPVEVHVDGTSPGELRCTVHNSGAVPPARLPVLFEPMTGADRRGEKARGLGLGLYITREVARAHMGSITVESTEAAGTTFRLVLPRAPPS